MRIGVDLMGSDTSPILLFEAIIQAADQFSEHTFVVLVTPDVVQAIWEDPALVNRLKSAKAFVEFHSVEDSITTDDLPLVAIRQKKASSLMVGLRLLKRRQLQGFVTAGNTGALVAGATLLLPRLPGIKRPALLATLPTKRGQIAVIDVGGHIACKAVHLVQFAHMGAAYQRCRAGITRPRVGLLNIGLESKKGRAEIQQAYQLLNEEVTSHAMEFVGNLEGHDVFEGAADVLITDGFTGNVLLKTCEGVSRFILDQLSYLVSKDQRHAILSQLHETFDNEAYSGAIVCGVGGLAIKCHGKTSARGLFNGIQGAIYLAQHNFIEQMRQQLS